MSVRLLPHRESSAVRAALSDAPAPGINSSDCEALRLECVPLDSTETECEALATDTKTPPKTEVLDFQLATSAATDVRGCCGASPLGQASFAVAKTPEDVMGDAIGVE
jgi:hypothetical protein